MKKLISGLKRLGNKNLEIDSPNINRFYQMLLTVVILIYVTSLWRNVEMMHFCDCVVFPSTHILYLVEAFLLVIFANIHSYK